MSQTRNVDTRQILYFGCLVCWLLFSPRRVSWLHRWADTRDFREGGLQDAGVKTEHLRVWSVGRSVSIALPDMNTASDWSSGMGMFVWSPPRLHSWRRTCGKSSGFGSINFACKARIAFNSHTVFDFVYVFVLLKKVKQRKLCFTFFGQNLAFHFHHSFTLFRAWSSICLGFS